MIRNNGTLTLREAHSCLATGARGADLDALTERIRGASGSEQSTAHRTKALQDEARQLGDHQQDLEIDQAAGEDRRRETEREIEAAQRGRPSVFLTAALVLFGTLLLLTDGAFLLHVFADALGLPLGSGYVAPLLFMVVLGITVLVLAVTTYSGSLATGAHYSPARRTLGWLLLIMLSVLVSVFRMASAPDGGLALAILGLAISLTSGIACGEAHHRIALFVVEYGRYRQEMDVLRKKLRSIEEHLDEIAEELEEVVARKGGIAIELDVLAHESDRLLWHTNQRVAKARHLYSVGAWFAGRKETNGKEASRVS